MIKIKLLKINVNKIYHSFIVWNQILLILILAAQVIFANNFDLYSVPKNELYKNQFPLVVHNTLKPFKSDGCSRFPDTFFKKDWTACCVIHDVAYWKGGSEEEKAAADLALDQCVSESVSDKLGTVMRWGVEMFGGPSGRAFYRWGYGWKYNRGYKSLSEQELQMTNQILDATETMFIVDDSSTQDFVPNEYPSPSKNYCLDAFAEVLQKKYPEAIVKKMKTTGYDNKIEFVTNLCDGKLIVSYNIAQTRMCTRRIYSDTNRINILNIQPTSDECKLISDSL